MAGYGFYEEDESVGLVTGASAIAKKRFTREIAYTKSGRKYPRRTGYTLEYAAKQLYNKQLAARNSWLKFLSENAELKELRQQMGQKMRDLAEAYRKTLTPEKQTQAKNRSKARKAAEERKKERDA